MATPFLIKRRAGWYLRIRIPAAFGKNYGTHLVKSLQTTNLAEARRRANRMAAALPKVLARIDAMPRRPITDLPEVGLELAKETLLKFEPPMRTRILDAMDVLIKDEEAAVEDLSDERERARMLLAYFHRIGDQREIKTLKDGDAARENHARASLAKGSMLPISAHLPVFFEQQGVCLKTEREYRNTYSRLLAKVGDKPVRELTENEVIEFFDWLPTTIRQRQNRKTAASATMQKHATALRTFFSWAVSKNLCVANLALKCQPSKASVKETKKYKKEPFSPEQLTRIFDLPLFTGCKSKYYINVAGSALIRDHRFYFPLVALMTGARLNELAQLLLSDVAIIDGSTYLFIRTEIDEDDELELSPRDLAELKRLKTENAKRRMPVHPILEQLGFLDFIEERRRKNPKDQRLFEAHQYGNQYNQRQFPAAKAKTATTSFHSFRHNFKDMVRGLVNNEQLQNRLMGHAPKTAGEIYGSALTKAEEQAFFALQPVISLWHLYQ